MDRLALVLITMSFVTITGALVIVLFTLGLYGAWWIAGSAVVGALTAWPAGFAVSRYVKAQDPHWHPKHEPGDFGAIPPRNAPEV